MVKKLFLIILFIIPSHRVISQNLIFNPNFEQQISCPQARNSLNLALGWSNPTLATPDYFSSCSSNPLFIVPNIENGDYQLAKSDSSYGGVIVYSTLNTIALQWREYMQGFMPTPLTAGKIYYFQMFVSLSNTSVFAISNIGVLFSITKINSNSTQYLSYTPQIENKKGLLTDTLN